MKLPCCWGDVFLRIQVATAFALCANRAEMFAVKRGELWHCQLDRAAYRTFTARLRAW